MLSLLPNERTGDHRDKPFLARPAVYISAYSTLSRTSNCLSLKVSLLFLFSHLTSFSFFHSFPSGIVFSHFWQPGPPPPSNNNKSFFQSWRAPFFPPETLTHTDTHTENRFPGIEDNPTIKCPIIAAMCQAKHQYTAL